MDIAYFLTHRYNVMRSDKIQENKEESYDSRLSKYK